MSALSPTDHSIAECPPVNALEGQSLFAKGLETIVSSRFRFIAEVGSLPASSPAPGGWQTPEAYPAPWRPRRSCETWDKRGSPCKSCREDLLVAPSRIPVAQKTPEPA